jgi:hypothetical protein
MVTIWLSSWSKSYYIDSMRCSFLLLWFLVKLALTDKAFKLHQDETHCLTLSTPPFRSAAGKEELCDGLNLVATHCRCLWCLVTWATIHLIFGNNQYGFALWVLRENAMTNVPMAQCKLGYCCNLSNSNYLSASSDPTLDQFLIFLSYVKGEYLLCASEVRLGCQALSSISRLFSCGPGTLADLVARSQGLCCAQRCCWSSASFGPLRDWLGTPMDVRGHSWQAVVWVGACSYQKKNPIQLQYISYMYINVTCI